MSDIKGMRGKLLTEMDPATCKPMNNALEKINDPIAREHAAHISGTNDMKEHCTAKPNLGTLGARSQAGK